MYKLEYLPLARKDLRDIVNYIVNTLKAPKAAMDFLDALEKSLFRVQQFPYACKVYHPVEPLESEYRTLPVKNYLVFYIVTEDAVEVRRIVYAKMNIEKLIK
ncbi:MAG: type II toxin-antitoxin system RelE/ParE family toxin [Firmicutes bacterium]|nr:type II toxin-antitoxin system RelE/ParE family toxin [Bacillota bacterium]